MKKSIVILHVFLDDKFFDGACEFFNSLNSVQNLYYFYSKHRKYAFKYIKSSYLIRLFSNYQEYISYFSDSKVDVICFHSLSPLFYKLFSHIDEQKKIIWWCWGFELYSSVWMLPPLVKMSLYKPLTRKEVQKESINLKSVLRFIYYGLKLPHTAFMRRKILERVDYFSPVFPIEYSLMQNIRYFRAKPFLIGGPIMVEEFTYSRVSSPQNILIGNSLTYTNNHLDIFSKIRMYQLGSQKYVIPINYGNAFNANHKKFKHLANLPQDRTIWLDDFLPYKQYKALFSSISHAIFGHMRQQSLGNINMCLQHSVKLFFYKNSLIYKQLIEWGYVVYTIEDDLTEESLKTVLPEEMALHNFSLNCRLLNNQVRLHKAEIELQSFFD